MIEYHYKAVRSYGPNSVAKKVDLDKALDDGYEFVRASEYVNGECNGAGYIEYILRKQIQEDKE